MQVSGVYKNIAICGPDFAQQHFVFQRMGLAHTDIHVPLLTALSCNVNHTACH